MKTILNEIVYNKCKEVEILKTKYRFSDFEKMPLFNKPIDSLVESLSSKDFGIIAEMKRKSPSAGVIKTDFSPLEIAQTYVEAGVAGISILTDFDYFGGSVEDVLSVKQHLNVPVLRKEFIIDEIQIFEAKAIGADAILLIAEILTAQQVKTFTIIAKSLGLEVIMELHDFTELDKIYEEVDILGVNNRNLKIQQTDLETSFRLAPYLPKNQLKISESGIKTAEEIKALAAVGYQGALIGESILKNPQMKQFLVELNCLSHEN